MEVRYNVTGLEVGPFTVVLRSHQKLAGGEGEYTTEIEATLEMMIGDKKVTAPISIEVLSGDPLSQVKAWAASLKGEVEDRPLRVSF